MRRIPKSAKARKKLRDELELKKLSMEVETEQERLASAKAEASTAQEHTFYGEVNEDTVREAMTELSQWSRKNPKSPMRIIFNSPGGYVTDGLALYDLILNLRHRGHHVTTVALGQAASMGGVLLQAGDRRVIGRNAAILIHEIAAGFSGKLSEFKDYVKFLEKQDERSLAILAQRSTMSAKEINVRCHKNEWWLDAEEAVKLGFADEILR